MGLLISGKDAISLVAFKLSDRVYTNDRSCQDQKTLINIWNRSVQIAQYRVFSHMLHSAADGLVVSKILPADSLVPALPYLYKMVNDKLSVTLHIDTSIASESSLFTDFSHIMAVRQTGMIILCASTVQEAYDFGILAHWISILATTPVLHFSDSKRIFDELNCIQPVEEDTLAGWFSQELINEKIKDRSALRSLEHTTYLSHKKDSAAEHQADLHVVFKQVTDEFNLSTQRSYRPFEYKGDPEAECVIIAMGIGAAVAQAVQSTLKTNAKIGVLKINLYRPWIDSDLLHTLPCNVKRVAVIEPSEHLTPSWLPLFLDVVAAYQSTGNNKVEIFSGQYGIQNGSFSPSQVRAVFEGLIEDRMERYFHLSSLPSQDNCLVEPSIDQLVFEGDIEVAKQFVSHQTPKKQAQLYPMKNSGITHVRLAEPGSGPFLPTLIEQSSNGLVVVEGNVNTLPACVKKCLYGKNAKIVSSGTLIDFLSQIGSRDLTESRICSIDTPEAWSTEPGFVHPIPAIKPQQMVEALPVEAPYLKILDQVFGSYLNIENAYNKSSARTPNTSHPHSAQPEFGYGRLMNHFQEHTRFVDVVKRIIQEEPLPSEAVRVLSQWLLLIDSSRPSHAKVQDASNSVITVLSSISHQYSVVQNILASKDLLYSRSHWLIGSDAWAQDLEQSGLHHVINSGEDINILIVDTTPYCSNKKMDYMKKNIGLYAMNYGSVYVASVALYSSYTGVLQALTEADSYKGPSVVLAYLPQLHEAFDAIFSMKETKICVDNGTWPLYRWNPALINDRENGMFKLDSQFISKQLQEFLDRENYLSQLVSSHPNMSFEISASLETDIEKRHKQLKTKAQNDYACLISGLNASRGSSLTVLFGSDNGNAENCAKKLASRAKLMGLQTSLLSLDDYSDIHSLANETNLVIVCSTAGQGDFPSNAREFWKNMSSLIVGDIELSELRFGVLGLGDSHYWPRREDAGFFNKPAKLLDAKLETLGANRLLDLGLADDQDTDGYETIFNSWQAALWKALGIRKVSTSDVVTYTDDQLKKDSNYLRGTISQDLVNESTGRVSEINQKLLKFHGAYLQEDRDLRESRKEQGLERAYSFLVRVRTPGGVATPKQWLAIDKIADKFGTSQLKLTTRQTFQIYGVLKRSLRSTIRAVNKSLLSTLGACGDVNRNIMSTVSTEIPEIHEQIQAAVCKLVDLLAPKTSAYHEIWLNNSMVAGHAVQAFEPIYGPTYLPRKFKIAIAVPPQNDVDVFAHDIGYIAIIDGKRNQVTGYNVLIGGGMGQTFGNKKTYPRQGSLIGYISADGILEVTQAIVTIQRDYGDRLDRKRARFKYTVDSHGVEFIKREIENRCGLKLDEPKPYSFKNNVDPYGWSKGKNESWNFCMFIENGRVKDTPDFQLKTGLRELAKFHRGEFRLTPNQHLLIADIPEHDLEKTKAHLIKYKMDNLSFSNIRKTSMACVALPTCGLALAESERYLPNLITLLEDIVEEAGLQNDSIVIRMTGCPNGCSRPYLAEIALVGRAPGTYNMYLGGSTTGDRLNKLYLESLNEQMILDALKPMIKRYALERLENEAFGDWVIRAGYVNRTISGLDFHEKT
ncbi:hypothetical protein BD560DRAFT_326302 [Blakeslea trispora]|nr:hypothetical protein BD560DRAFT_326302 [Blakeslea trispora]